MRLDFFFQAEDGIRDLVRSRGLGDVYKRQPLFNSASEFRKDKADGNAEIINDTFDLMTFREQFDIDYEDDLGVKKNISGNQRYYIPPEITWLLKSLGYQNIDICGAKLGAFSRKDKLTVQDFEMLVIAEL